MKTDAIVLAAGGSARLGRPKQLVAWRGRPLLEHVVHSTSAWPVDEVLVVVGASASEILGAVDVGDAKVVRNDHWQDGMASSLAAGLEASDADRAFIVLGDQPEIPPDVPGALAARPGPVVLPVYRGVRSNPALVSRDVWPDLIGLSGDRGAAGLFRAHPEWVEELAVDADPPFDIDTGADLGGQDERRSSSWRSASSE